MKHIRFLAVLCIILSLVIACVNPLMGVAFATLSGVALMPKHVGACYAPGPLNLLDLALRSGKGVHALMEGVVTYAPEMMTFGWIPKDGLDYSTLMNTALPSGDFFKVGSGVAIQKSEWKREKGSMVPFGAQMRVPWDVVTAAKAEDKTLKTEDILSSEAIKHLKGSAIRIGSQVWYGKKISADGFVGLSTQVTATYDVSAGAADNVPTSSAYLVYMDASLVNPEGVHFVSGNGGTMEFPKEWKSQQVEITPGKFGDVHTNSFMSYMGLVVPRNESVLRIRNIDEAHPLTDLLVAKLKSKIPIGLQGDLSKWRLFMNSGTRFTLQSARLGVAAAAGVTSVPEPVDSCGIKIQLTDSLVDSELKGLKP